MSSLELSDKFNIITNLFADVNINPFIESPKMEHYRNKINLSFGKYNGNIEVGELQKDKTVIPAKLNKHASIIGIKICEFMRDWIIKSSDFGVINYNDYTGLWRHITIYNNRFHHVMIVFHLQNVTEYKHEWELEFSNLKFKLDKFISENNYYLNSIYLQNSNTKKETRNNDPYYLIYGYKNYCEVLDNYSFKISPGSFFQVNSDTAEIIYNKIKDISEINKESIVLDMCCGTGTIGCFLANSCNLVYSIDTNNNNIQDAKTNRYLNQIKNQNIIKGKIEDVIPKILNKYTDLSNITAIINPPRKGIGINMCNFIKNSKIKKIVYVSCNINSFKKDLDNMEITNKEIKEIIPINQFPSTKHFEIIANIMRI